MRSLSASIMWQLPVVSAWGLAARAAWSAPWLPQPGAAAAAARRGLYLPMIEPSNSDFSVRLVRPPSGSEEWRELAGPASDRFSGAQIGDQFFR